MRPEELEEILVKVEDGLKLLTSNFTQNTNKQLTQEIKKVTDAIQLPEIGPEHFNQLTTSVTGIQDKIDDMGKSEFGISFVPFLDSGENAHNWMRYFSNICEFKNYDTDKKILAFKTLLRNGGAIWFSDTCSKILTEAGKTSADKWEDMKTKFLEHFHQSNTWLEEHALHFVQQLSDESVHHYYSKLQERTSRLKKSDQETMSLFIRGLNGHIKLYVLARQPKTIAEALNLAKTAQSLQQISQVATTFEDSATLGEILPQKIVPPRNNNNSMLEEIKRINTSLEQVKKSVNDKKNESANKFQARSQVRCHFCGVPNHRISECRKRLYELQRMRDTQNRFPDRQRFQPNSYTQTAPRQNFQRYPVNRQPVRPGQPYNQLRPTNRSEN